MFAARRLLRRQLAGLALLLAGAGSAACQDGASADGRADPAPTAAVVVRTPDGAVAFEAAIRGGACAATGLTDGSRIAPGHAGPEVLGADGAARARIHRAGGRLDLTDPQGVPIARIVVEDGAARVVDAARAPVARLAADGGRIAVTAPGGAALAEVTGTDDLELAAIAAAPGLDPEVRARLACASLGASPSAP